MSGSDPGSNRGLSAYRAKQKAKKQGQKKAGRDHGKGSCDKQQPTTNSSILTDITNTPQNKRTSTIHFFFGAEMIPHDSKSFHIRVVPVFNFLQWN